MLLFLQMSKLQETKSYFDEIAGWVEVKSDIACEYLIWKLTYSAKIEVAYVEIAASGGRRSGQVPGKKIQKSAIFELQRKLRTIVI